MKKVYLTSLFLCLTTTAFSQGKVALAMDLPLIFWGPWAMLPGDVAFANSSVPTTGPLPSGIILRVGLYGGTSSSSLSLISSEAINPAGGTGLPAGYISRLNIVCPFAGGSFDYFQVKVWDSAYATFEAQAAAGRVETGRDYDAWNNVFMMIPGTSISYPQVYNGGSTTWVAVGNEDVSALLVAVGHGPEPSTLALAALGAAALAVRRRINSLRPRSDL